MYSFDASSVIHAWDNYPPENQHFNSLWDWIAEQVNNHQFSISKIAFDEVNQKTPKCGEWLKDKDIKIYTLSKSIILIAQQIKTDLGIVEEKYSNRGVGENDLFIIGTAKETRTVLISEESQSNLPKKKSNYKIPTVCSMLAVHVECIRFIDLLN